LNNSLSFRRMLAFSVGDFFGGGAFNIINFLYPGFLALAVGLPAHLAGLVMFIARIFDCGKHSYTRRPSYRSAK